MNLVLLDDADFCAEKRAVVRGRRLEHVRSVHRAAVGDTLRVGRIDGEIGVGRILSLEPDRLELEVALDAPPPEPSPLELVVALPRPPSLRKVLQQATSGREAKSRCIASRRVEKSYWQSHALDPDALREQLRARARAGARHAAPRGGAHRRFRPFVEDELPGLLARVAGPLAGPDSREPIPCPPPARAHR